MAKKGQSFEIQQKTKLSSNQEQPQGRLNVYDNSQPVADNSTCVLLAKTLAKICIFPVKSDTYVSKTIALGRYWEANIVNLFIALLNRDPQLHVIDIGANIGQYSLIGANLGRHVVAVDAKLKHVQMIHHSLVLNNYQKHVTIVHNAVSNSRSTGYITTRNTNQGASYVVQGTPNTTHQQDHMTTDIILMDDLAPIVNFSKAIMKIDIEGYEDKALSHADKLFDKVSIPYIFMEWGWMQRDKTQLEIEPLLEWLTKRGYSPYTISVKTKKKLDIKAFKKWPNDVIFRKD